MNTEIYYFSGTGNSLHAAKEVQKRIPDAKLIPMVSLLDRDVIEINSESVGFVFPIHLTTIPIPVRIFFDKINFIKSEYIFSISTRTGTISVADIYLKKILKKKGKTLDSFLVLNMADNSPTGLKPAKGNKNWVNSITDEKIKKLDTVVQDELDVFQKVVNNRERYPLKDSFNPLKYLLENLISFLTKNSKAEIPFYADSTCNGCGICGKVCPSKKIKLIDEKPLWQKNVNCFYCYACFNYCPEQAILVKNRYEQKNGRYHYPDITVSDIENQK